MSWVIWFAFRACLALLVVEAPPADAPPIQASSRPADPAELVRQLADRDPEVRRGASQALAQMGEAARPAVIRASHSPHPQLAAGATEVLMSLPWSRPDDPMPVRQVLADYGGKGVADRIGTVAALGALGSAAHPALLRLLQEDPSLDVAWHIVLILRPRPEAELAERLRELDLTHARAPALTLAGRAWLRRDLPRGRELLRRAVELERLNPSFDNGELDRAIDDLVELAVHESDPVAAADYRRLQALRIGLQRDAYPTPVFQLLALHANHGPLPGLEQDLRLFARFLSRPQALYALGKIHQRDPNQAMLAAAFHTAALATPQAPRERVETAKFLLESDWTDLAERELQAVLDADAAAEGKPIAEVNARFYLASIARGRKEDKTAAGHLLSAVQAIRRMNGAALERTARDGQSVPLRLEEVEAEAHWLLCRSAHRAGDAVAFDEHLAKLLELGPTGTDVALDLVPLLDERQRRTDADRLFEMAYQPLRQRLDAGPGDVDAMNELAWLCARSSRRLEEALALSRRTVEVEPDNAAYLDTLAEVNFRLGNVEEAIRHEERALELRPGDKFMAEQLERFRSGRK